MSNIAHRAVEASEFKRQFKSNALTSERCVKYGCYINPSFDVLWKSHTILARVLYEVKTQTTTNQWRDRRWVKPVGKSQSAESIPNQIKIKSLLLSHHHSTSALVSEILMSVLQTVQKNNNRQFTYGQTVQKNNKQFTYGQTVQKNNKQFTYGQTVQKNNKQFTYGQTVQKNNKQFTYGQTVQKNNSNLHMDSTYLQTVQKTMCKIHIHILSTLSVL